MVAFKKQQLKNKQKTCTLRKTKLLSHSNCSIPVAMVQWNKHLRV